MEGVEITYASTHMASECPEPIPPRPWGVVRYGFSLSQVKDAYGHVVLDELNFNIAEFIVRGVNAYGENENRVPDSSQV